MVIAAATATAMQVRENLVGAMDCLLALSNGTGSGRLTLECGVRAEGRGQSPKLTNRERGLAGVGGGRGRGLRERKRRKLEIGWEPGSQKTEFAAKSGGWRQY